MFVRDEFKKTQQDFTVSVRVLTSSTTLKTRTTVCRDFKIEAVVAHVLIYLLARYAEH